jgi:hypothetical protein
MADGYADSCCLIWGKYGVRRTDKLARSQMRLLNMQRDLSPPGQVRAHLNGGRAKSPLLGRGPSWVKA